MDVLHTMITLLPVSLTAGVNLYATVLMLGLSVRFGWVQYMPDGFEALASWWIIGTAGVFYLLEFFADKVQFIDNLWDLVHTIIRPLGMAFMAFGALGTTDPAVAVLAALAAGGIALTSHGGKAGLRAVVNVVSPAENLSNAALSVGEDAGVFVLVLLALKYPWVTAGIAIVILALIIILLPRLLRWAWFTIRAVFARLKGLMRKVAQPDPLPTNHLVLLRHRKPGLAARCQGQGIKGTGGRTGYVSVFGKSLVFTYDTLFGSRFWRLPRAQIDASYLRHRPLMDVVEVHYRDNGKARAARFAFMKDRAVLAQQLAAMLGAAGVEPVT